MKFCSSQIVLYSKFESQYYHSDSPYRFFTRVQQLQVLKLKATYQKYF